VNAGSVSRFLVASELSRASFIAQVVARGLEPQTIQLDEAADMRMKSIAFHAAFLAVLIDGIAVSPAAIAQESRGTMEQQMACTPDVWRLCSDQIPDANRIVACLRANTPSLSDACRAVFDTSNRVAPPPSRGRRPPPAAAPPVQPPPRNDDWFR
jgi:hypothetical protein